MLVCKISMATTSSLQACFRVMSGHLSSAFLHGCLYCSLLHTEILCRKPR